MARTQLLDWEVAPEPAPTDLPDGTGEHAEPAGPPAVPDSIFERYADAFRSPRGEAPDVSSGSVLR